MSALIIRIPPEKRERLKQVAKARNVSVNKLIEEMATLAIAEHDAEMRFRIRAARGQPVKIGRAHGSVAVAPEHFARVLVGHQHEDISLAHRFS